MQPAAVLCDNPRHGFYESPREWCADCCTPEPPPQRRSPVQRRQQEIILPTDGPVEAHPFAWYADQVARPPLDVVYLHLARTPRVLVLANLLETLPGLRLLQAPPNMRWLLRNRQLLSICRFRSIGVWAASLYDV